MNEENNIEQSPEDGKIESPEENPGENISSPESIVQTETQIEKSLPDLPSRQAGEIQKSEIENMEVHHHPHVEKKNFKEYLLEGLMIFLAVTLGFFAENLREHITETNRENGFAQELYTELKDDSTAAANKLAARLDKEKAMDYLTGWIRDSSLTELPKNFYPAYTKSLYFINMYAFEPRDGILSQLRNSGSVLYFENIELQKLLGDINVSINNIRYRNDQEYQYFANPLKEFLLEHYDFNWLDQLRNNDKDTSVLNVINRYMQSRNTYKSSILNVSSIDRIKTCNMILFFKQMLISTQSLQMNNYIRVNHEILETLRKNYPLQNE